MPGVHIRENESFEKALRRFNKTCMKEGILSEIRKRQHFEKPSERRKRKINSAKRKLLKRDFVQRNR
ncbi:MAG: 30S ribosomal protein S21 [Gemmatimonadota bacterium]|nr:MAG: 30S ribosomal protein S21 [Gemmatimonadota bacterium]